LYYASPQAGARWQGFFDRALITPDDALVARAHERLWAGRLERAGGAVETFTAALQRDPASPYRWCELGEALVEAGRIEQARYCFLRGVALGPGTPSILMRAANLHFRLGESRAAVAYTTRVLEMTPEFDQVIFSSYSRLGVSVQEALSNGVPRDRRAAQAFLRYLIEQRAPREAEAVWDWARGHSFVDDGLADAYAGFLLVLGRHDAALQAWAAHFGARSPGFPQANRLFNAGFESDPAGATFDWRIERLAGVEVERDNSTSASGRWSLRVRFDGQENLSFHHVSQRAVVRPGACRFQAQIRTLDLSTDQGIGFQIVDAEDGGRLDLKTERWLGTRDWTKVEQSFVIPERTRLVEVRLVREASLKFDSKIRGTAWIDDVRLAPGR
jgi:hypothetical protein